jgi:hypothetical protein
LPAFAQQSVHGGLRAQIDAFIQQDRPYLARGLVGEAGRVQYRQHLLALIFRQFGRVTERPARTVNGRTRMTVPVHRCPGSAEHLTGSDRADRLLQGREMLVEDPVQFVSESALLEMS